MISKGAETREKKSRIVFLSSSLLSIDLFIADVYSGFHACFEAWDQLSIFKVIYNIIFRGRIRIISPTATYTMPVIYD